MHTFNFVPRRIHTKNRTVIGSYYLIRTGSHRKVRVMVMPSCNNYRCFFQFVYEKKKTTGMHRRCFARGKGQLLLYYYHPYGFGRRLFSDRVRINIDAFLNDKTLNKS